MDFNKRELILLCVTAVLLLFGATYFVGKPKLAALKQAQKTIIDKEVEILSYRDLFDLQPMREQELDLLKDKLPAYEKGQSVLPVFRTQIVDLAAKRELGIAKTRSTPDRLSIGNLPDAYTYSVDCDYQGTLRSLVGFLYDVQEKGSAFDIQTLTVRPHSREVGVVRGSFVVDCAYRETDVVEDIPESTPPSTNSEGNSSPQQG